MEYIYAAMLLHSAKKEVNEANVKKVLEAAGIKAEEGRVKALVSALEGVDIEAAVKEAVMAPAAQVVSAPAHSAPAAKKEEKKSEEEAAASLSSLFG